MDDRSNRAWFSMRCGDQPGLFTFELRDAGSIAHARRVLRREETARVHVTGTIVKERAWYNPRWSYHLAPTSIEFFENAIEVCDASFTYVEEHLSEVGGALLPNHQWCPWCSVLVCEVQPPGADQPSPALASERYVDVTQVLTSAVDSAGLLLGRGGGITWMYTDLVLEPGGSTYVLTSPSPAPDVRLADASRAALWLARAAGPTAVDAVLKNLEHLGFWSLPRYDVDPAGGLVNVLGAVLPGREPHVVVWTSGRLPSLDALERELRAHLVSEFTRHLGPN